MATGLIDNCDLFSLYYQGRGTSQWCIEDHLTKLFIFIFSLWGNIARSFLTPWSRWRVTALGKRETRREEASEGCETSQGGTRKICSREGVTRVIAHIIQPITKWIILTLENLNFNIDKIFQNMFTKLIISLQRKILVLLIFICIHIQTFITYEYS